MTIALFGATGQLGGALIDSLLARGVDPEQIRALGREPQRLEALRERGLDSCRVELDNPSDVAEGVRGADRVMLISGSDNRTRVAQHRSVIDASVAEGVSLLVYTSAPQATTSALVLAPDHKATEGSIAASGLPAVILRNCWYTENYRDTFEQARATGRIANCVGDGRVASAPRKDYADAAAAVLTAASPKVGVYELSGDVAWDFRAFAATATRVLGRDVEYAPVSPEQERADVLAQGLDEQAADFVVALDENTRDGLLALTTGQLRDLIGRPTTTLQTTMQGWV